MMGTLNAEYRKEGEENQSSVKKTVPGHIIFCPDTLPPTFVLQLALIHSGSKAVNKQGASPRAPLNALH